MRRLLSYICEARTPPGHQGSPRPPALGACLTATRSLVGAGSVWASGETLAWSRNNRKSGRVLSTETHLCLIRMGVQGLAIGAFYAPN